MTDTAIEWTDKTWNPVTGCTKVSPGCAYCYAETVADRFWKTQYPQVLSDGCALKTRPRQFTDVQTHADRLDQPLHWKKPARIFVNSMSDLFHEDVSDAFIDEVFCVMFEAKQHTFQVLTKRAERMQRYMGTRTLRHCDTLPNVWLGVSVENQHFADARIPLLLQTPAAIRFISAEPLLGSVDLTAISRTRADGFIRPLDGRFRTLDWVIVGGESGANARPLWVPCVRSIVRQCQDVGVPVFVKQLGADVRDRNDAGFTGDGDRRSWPDMDPDDIEEDLDGSRDGYQGAPVRVHLRSKKGGDPSEWPEDLRVREFPPATAKQRERV